MSALQWHQPQFQHVCFVTRCIHSRAQFVFSPSATARVEVFFKCTVESFALWINKRVACCIASQLNCNFCLWGKVANRKVNVFMLHTSDLA